MKTKLLLTLALVAAMCCGCAHQPVAQATGLEDRAYLLLVSPDEYAGKEVTVVLDGKNSFPVRVVKEKNSKRKGTRYGIATGRRNIKVQFEGKTIYSKDLFVSTQETKIIQLP